MQSLRLLTYSTSVMTKNIIMPRSVQQFHFLIPLFPLIRTKFMHDGFHSCIASVKITHIYANFDCFCQSKDTHMICIPSKCFDTLCTIEVDVVVIRGLEEGTV